MRIKLLILFAFLFITLIAKAQREVALDTLYITNESGKIFIYSYIEYTDGGRKGNFPGGDYRMAVPDTSAAINFILGETVNKARQYSDISQKALQKAQTVSALQTNNTAIFNFAGISLLDSLSRFYAQFLVGEDWTFRTASGPETNVTVTQNAQGVLRLNFGGGVIRSILVFSDNWIRIQNYPNGTNTDFFLMPSGSFVSVGENASRNFVLRKQSIAQQIRAQNKQ